jgi:hypothetical protein
VSTEPLGVFTDPSPTTTGEGLVCKPNTNDNPRFSDGTFAAWAETAVKVGFCAQPIHLRGQSETFSPVTGEVTSVFTSKDTPLGELYVPCGNRRAEVCPACSRTYARDVYAMIKAGVVGGKTIPDTVANNPLLFVTFTAPSFGHVHGTRPHPKTKEPTGGMCRPRGDRATTCPHGVKLSCHTRHQPGDPALGAPLCAECYDWASAIVWQWWAPELWRRTTIALKRALARELDVTESQLNQVASLQYAKVAEYQQRGLVHFHALIRLGGPKAAGPGAPALLDADTLANLVQTATKAVTYQASPVHRQDVTRVLSWGNQLDIKKVARDPDNKKLRNQALTPEQVAGYLAKYATKDATTMNSNNGTSEHLKRLRATCTSLWFKSYSHYGTKSPYQLLKKWADMYGFRGHFTTKSRAYSVTLGRLRRARRRYAQLTQNSVYTPLDTRDLEAHLLADNHDEETTLVISQWTYHGTGWDTNHDTQMALASAAQARAHAQQQASMKHTHQKGQAA